MDPTEKHVVIRSYDKAWKIENRIYAIQNLVLPVPISPRAILFFLVSFAIVWLVCTLITPLRAMPFILRGVILPVAFTSFCLKVKLDGHSPQKYILGAMQYMFSRNRYVEHFKQRATPTGSIRLCWICSRGNKLREGMNHARMSH